MSDQTPRIDPHSTADLERPCRHCGRALVLFSGVPMHASAWDEAGQREIYRHCRVHVAEPAAAGEQPADVLERETALTTHFHEAGVDWKTPTPRERDALDAFRAGWRAARA